MAEAVRVYIVAGDGLARAGLAALLGGQPGCVVVGQGPADDGLADSLAIFRPDVLLWDLGWQPDNALRQLAEARAIELPIAVLLPAEVHAAAAWGAGARGLLLREATPEQIVAAVAALALGLAVLDPELAAGLRTRHDDAQPGLTETLTQRELEVLHLLAEGLPNKIIANRLRISEHTVKFHVNAILGKLGVQSRTEAVVQATRLGLVLL